MPKILKTHGVCLSSRKVRETSKIATFYTEKFGKLAFIAKGARNPNSKFGSALEIFTLSELIFYKPESKSVYLISDATIIDDFPRLKSSDKFIYANQIVELPLRAVNFEDPNHKLFNLLLASLQILNQTNTKRTANFNSLLGAYFLKAITLLGFKPELSHCVLCKNDKIKYFSIEHGGAICEKHSQDNKRSGMEQIKTIKYLLTKPLSKSLQLTTSPATTKLIQDYLIYHLEKVQLHSFDFNPILETLKK